MEENGEGGGRNGGRRRGRGGKGRDQGFEKAGEDVKRRGKGKRGARVW